LAIAPRIKKGTKIWREVKLSTSFFNLALFQIIEAVPKRFPLTAGFKIKEGENFNHRNTFSISRIKI